MGFDRGSYDNETFTDIELPGAVIEAQTFYDCRFEDCRLSGASLKRSRFVDCVFSHCDLRLADMTDTDLSGVHFSDAALVGVNFSLLAQTPLLPLELRFESCALMHATFRDLDLSGSSFENCLLRDAEFSSVKLLRSSLAGADLQDAVFQGCDLSGADLRGARNYQLSTRHNVVTGLKVSFPEALGLLAGLELVIS